MHTWLAISEFAILLVRLRSGSRAVRFLVPNLSLDDRSCIELATTDVPPDHGAQEDESQENNGVVHVVRRDRSDRWQDENDGHEKGPDASPAVDEEGELAQMPWTRLEFVPDDLASDRDDVGPVEGDSAYVENTCDRNVRAQGNEVDGDAPEDADPDCIQRCSRESVDLGPNFGEGNELVAGEGEHGSRQCLCCGPADELENEEGGNGEEETGAFAQ